MGWCRGCAVARARVRPRRDRVSPQGRASPPPFTAGCTPWATPSITARHGNGGCGPDAALSHGSAAALWRIVPRWPSPTHVTAPSERDRPGIHVHRSPNAEATTHYGIRVTTPTRTLVDLADVLTPNNSPEPSTRPRSNGSPRPKNWPPSSPDIREAHITPDARAGRHPLSPRSLRTGPRPRRRPPQRGVSHAPHHPPTPQTPTRPQRRNGSTPSCAAEAARPPGSRRAVGCRDPRGSRATASRRAPPGGPRARAAPSRCRRPRRRRRRRRPRS